jgi:D-serine/D-alanine/glycine transporter
MCDDVAAPNDAVPHLHRGLSNRHIQLIAIGGAIGTGLFMGSGRTISLAGPAVVVVYGIIGFFVFFVLRAMGELLLSNLNYKSFVDFSADLLGPAAGFFVGWSYWFAWIATGIAEVVAIVCFIGVGAILLATNFVSPQGHRATVANLWNDGGFFATGFMGVVSRFQIAFFAFVGVELVGTAAA